MTVSALFGTLTLGTNDGSLVFTQDTSGPTGSTMSFKGTEANLNNALDELVYTPTLNHNDLVGSEVLTIFVSDLGSNGSEVLNDSATISVEITASMITRMSALLTLTLPPMKTLH